MLVHRHTAASTKESGPRESTVVSNTSIAKNKDDKARTKKSKVKTGCFTCKIRRVKCDEAKPYCKRCLRFGVDCDGYPSTYRPSSATASRKILPKDGSSKIEIPESSNFRKIYSGPQFEDEEEGRYFRLFCEETADQLSGPAQSPLWKHLIPQACEAQPFVRHVVVAIAALSKINAESSIHDSIGSPEYLYALKQYSKSLRGMRLSVESGIHDMRNALLACILVFCFETLQGNPGTAAAHARSGLMLLHLWMQEHLDKKVPFYEVGDWTEFQINREIMCTFAQLDAQILWFMDGRPEWVHRIAIEQSNEIIKRLPARLSNIDEVRLYGCLMLRRNYRFVLLALAASKSKELGEEWTNECEVAWEGSAALSPSESILGTANLPVPELMEESLAYREDIRRFDRSTALFFDGMRESGTQKEKVIGAIWEMYCLMGHIMLAGIHFTDEPEWDQFLPEFQRILALGQYCQPHLIEPLKGKTRYRFDLGTVVGLCLVALRCRHRPTRHATIDLLRSAHYREGIIDSHAAALVGSWSASIEEQGMDENGYIPGHKRVFLTRMVMDLPNRRALLGCSQRNLEGLVYRKGVMTW